ncbi:recombination-associated protein RdgC [Flocculibacter collagenilyticus]|uniref:recombination-associated protein RdgC n=1 Tax=Flocculibacter collagenilyticus TaxID=2744479 RepID=UPI0018F29304|nr:recombination-associated protein RdgC [Flocculibacter collagenilyticus]
MWFSNLYFYRFTKPFELSADELDKRLEANIFSPCGSQDIAKFGWVNALGKYGQTLSHSAAGNLLLCAKREEKILPTAVINDMLAEKVEAIELKESRPVKKKEKDTLKEDIIHQLLPRAFSKSSLLYGYIAPQHDLLVINSSSATKAEEFMAMLRKCVGTLPVVPVQPEQPLSIMMTDWLKSQNLPAGYEFGSDAELKSTDEEEAVVKYKQQDLGSDEIQLHIEHNKLVTKLALLWHDNVNFMLADDFSLKRIKFTDLLKEQNEDIPKEDMATKLDADFALMSGEINMLLNELIEITGAKEVDITA